MYSSLHEVRDRYIFLSAFYSRMLLQPDDSLQILAPVEADVGFYACNASNALGSDSVSIAVTLAGNSSLPALAGWSLPLVWFWTEALRGGRDVCGSWAGKVGPQRYTGDNAGCELWKNLSPTFTVILLDLWISAGDGCLFSHAASAVVSRQLSSWLFTANMGSAVQASQFLCFILNLLLASSSLTGWSKDLLRYTLGKPKK